MSSRHAPMRPRAMQAAERLGSERAAREEAAAAVAKLEEVIAGVRREMMDAQEAASKVGGPLQPLALQPRLRFWYGGSELLPQGQAEAA